MSKKKIDRNLKANMDYIGSVLRNARNSAGLSLRELSVDSGIAYPNISIIENGGCAVKISTLSVLFTAMDMTIEDAVIKYDLIRE